MSTDQSTDHPQTPQPPGGEPSTGPLALVVQPDGPATLARLPQGGIPAQDREQLAAIQDTLAGEADALGDGRWLVLVNAARHELGLPVNTQATLLARAVGLGIHQDIEGAAMFLSHEGSELADVSAAVVEFARQQGVLR